MPTANMPTAKKPAKKKPALVRPVAPMPPPTPVSVAFSPSVNPDNLPVKYAHLEIDEYSTVSPKGPLDPQWCKAALGWETEREFQARKVAELPGSKPEAWLFGENGPALERGGFQPIHCKNVAGEKVVCWQNAHNRPFDSDWCESLVHTILYGQWAGPFTIPGETVNGETVRISCYGRVLSGQHQMTACILAGEWLAKARNEGMDPPADPKYPVWAKLGIGAAPFIETVVIKGVSEDSRVLQTIDYVKPRGAADVFYTSGIFKTSTAPERKELCRMLAGAVDFLWTRTGTKGYRTHPEIVGFLDRHKRLLECVLHLFGENDLEAGRKISKLRLSPGQCAALMYLMAASETKPEDSDVYRNMEPPTEKGVDFSLWDRAEEFWTLLAGGNDFQLVRTALARLVDSTAASDENQGLGGRWPEKLAILALAWERWKDYSVTRGPPFDVGDLADGGLLSLSYSGVDDQGRKLPDGQIKLVNLADFYGIDCPEVTKSSCRAGPPEPPPPTGEEYDRLRREAQERHTAADEERANRQHG